MNNVCDFSWKIKEENDRSVDIQFFIVNTSQVQVAGGNESTN